MDRIEATDRQIIQVTWIGLLLNLFLAVLKLCAGVIGRSQAVLADGIHSFTDLSSDLVLLAGVRFWSKPADEDHPHGHRRIETLVTVSIGLLLLMAAVGMLLSATRSLMQPAQHPGWIALVATVVSLLGKEWLYHYTIHRGKKLKCMALQANAWHHRSDALSSIPVLVAVIGIRLRPEWRFLDSAAAFIVVFFIAQAAFRIIKPSVNKLLDIAASPGTVLEIKEVLSTINEIRDVHKVRTRYIGDSLISVDLHIEVDGEMSVRDGHDIATLARDVLMNSELDIGDVVVHLEPWRET